MNMSVATAAFPKINEHGHSKPQQLHPALNSANGRPPPAFDVLISFFIAATVEHGNIPAIRSGTNWVIFVLL